MRSAVSRSRMRPATETSALPARALRMLSALPAFQPLGRQGGGPVNSTHMLSTYSYKLSFEMFKYSKGAAVANVLLVILLIVGVFYLRATKEEEGNG